MSVPLPGAARVQVARPIVWFAAASMMTTILHELVHAGAAFALGVRSTLFNYSANLDLTPAQASTHLAALIGVAGPVFCLALGIGCRLALTRAVGLAVELPLLFFTVFGVGTFFGNMMSASFVGDFSAAAAALGLPMGARHALSLTGAVGVAAIHFWAGRRLMGWVPVHTGSVAGALTVVLTAAAGTGIMILANAPMPASWARVRLAESAFWIFAAAGALMTRREPGDARANLGLRWADGAVLMLAVLAVRLLRTGIPLEP